MYHLLHCLAMQYVIAWQCVCDSFLSVCIVCWGDMNMYVREVRMSSKRALGSLEQELQLVMSCAMPVLRFKLGPNARALCAPDCCHMSLGRPQVWPFVLAKDYVRWC